jgi:L-ribulose-5-phosphate 4-epimerase
MSPEITALAETVCALHAELVRNGLVAWTSGNVSARVPGADLMVIKPSGVSYDDLHARGRRGGAHALDLRDRVGGAR